MKSLFSFVLIVAVLLSVERSAEGQQPAKLSRIGLLSRWNPSDKRAQNFRQVLVGGLHKLGYVEGQNVVIEYRFGKRDQLAHSAAELVRLEVDLIIAVGPTATGYAIKEAGTIPVVMVGSGHAVSRGFVKSLTQPGGNVTGLSSFVEGETAKRIELLKETVPSIFRVAVLNRRRRKNIVRKYQHTGKALGMDVQAVNFRKWKELDKALSSVAAIRPDALITVSSGKPITSTVVPFTLKHRLPSLFTRKRFVKAGGLMSYDIDRAAMYRRVAIYVDKILKGANPATLPVEPPRLELVINLKTARKIGVKIPPEILLEANEIIK